MSGHPSSDRTPELSRRICVAEVGQKSKRVDIEADGEERRALAERLGLVDLKDFAVSAIVHPMGEAGVRVVGTFEATVVQMCSVSLEPVEEQVSEAFDVPFMPPERIALTVVDPLDFEDDELPELIENGEIELGEVLSQLLALAINPYPRKTNASSDTGHLADVGEPSGGTPLEPGSQPSPFSVLEKLKNRLD